MLMDRYQQEDIFVRVPQMTARIDPVLRELDRLLDDDELYQAVRADFSQRHRRTLVFGRPSTPVEVLLRMLLLKQLFGWSYQELEDRVDESLVLRWFSRLSWKAAPDDTTLIRWARTLQAETLHQLYQKLVETTEQMVKQTSRAVEELRKQTQQQAKRLVQEAESMLPLIERVIAQTRSRVLEGKKVPSEQKVLSLFEPHTRAIPRHKGGALVEFGRQVILDEVEGGIVTRYEILAHPNEHGQAVSAIERHLALFEHPPGVLAADRGVHSPETEALLKQAGVKLVAIPASGKLSEERKAFERTRRFRRGYRWRAGIEGRIASLRRDYGWRTCRFHGQDGMERWLGLGVLASNLRHIAQTKVQKNSTPLAA